MQKYEKRDLSGSLLKFGINSLMVWFQWFQWYLQVGHIKYCVELEKNGLHPRAQEIIRLSWKTTERYDMLDKIPVVTHPVAIRSPKMNQVYHQRSWSTVTLCMPSPYFSA